ncbi:trypsin-like peptidase domain-containing protein [Streptomyces sp. NPDC058674]|uniref:trypsin-like peptidase domain-containing protein n=1 Tax=Streptomyces sp. NPDC058674 TaxID=3346592 RepID=UPI00364F5F03
MTAVRLGRRDSDALQRCAVGISVGGAFRGSGFLVAPGVVLTAAHVVSTPGPAPRVSVEHPTGSRLVAAEDIRAEPDTGDGSRFHPFPDLAALTVPGWRDHPVARLAPDEAEPGTEVTALGYSTHTPSPGVQPDTLALRVAGRSGPFIRVLGDGVREGMSGSMLLDADGLVRGLLKGSRSYRDAQGGWYVPVAALAGFLGGPSALPGAPARPGAVAAAAGPGDAEFVEALMAFPAMMRPDGRYDLFEKIGDHLGLPHSFEVEDRPDRRDHLYRLVRRCRVHRDERAALRALYTAMEELVPYDNALDRLRVLVGQAVGEGEGG